MYHHPQNLPDLDAGGIGFGNKTDAYVKVHLEITVDNTRLTKPLLPQVKAGLNGEEKKTKTKGGSLNPVFDPASSKFTFNVSIVTPSPKCPMCQVSSGTRIYFTVMDKDTVTKDDLVGTVGTNLNSKYQLCWVKFSQEIQPQKLNIQGGKSDLTV